MTLTGLGVLLTGIWLIIASQELPSTRLTLIFGIVVCALVLWDAFAGGPVVFRRRD